MKFEVLDIPLHSCDPKTPPRLYRRLYTCHAHPSKCTRRTKVLVQERCSRAMVLVRSFSCLVIRAVVGTRRD
ncbi:hypothetical protein VTL71DRAFT_4749 [Oculimacula yallundae]|uniref:Uncharacterized protein n=1 Tax=Oculimacula yallundae TaxID=86028 RepID=A0ABR4C3M8_9HELO